MYAQPTGRIDSLENALKQFTRAGNDTSALRTLLDLSAATRSSDNARSISSANRAIALSKRVDKPAYEIQAYQRLGAAMAVGGKWEGSIEQFVHAAQLSKDYGLPRYEHRSLNNLGIVYQRLQRYEESIDAYTRSIQLKKESGDVEEIPQTLINLGSLYRTIEDNVSALDVYLEAARLLKDGGSSVSLANLYNNIGNLYVEIDQLELALDQYEFGLVIYEEIGHKEGTARSYMNIGRLQQHMERYAQSSKNLRKSADLYTAFGYPVAEMLAHQNRGIAYSNDNNYDAATFEFRKALDVAVEENDEQGRIYSQFLYADALFHAGRYEEALSHAEQAYELTTKSGTNLYLSELLFLLYEVNRALERYGSALEWYESQTAYRDSLTKQMREFALDTLVVRYGYELQEAEREALRQQRQLQANELLRKQLEVELIESEKEQKQTELLLQQEAIRYQRTQAEQDSAAIQYLRERQNLQQLEIQNERTRSTFLLLTAAALFVIVVLLVILYRIRKSAEERQKQKNLELEEATRSIMEREKELEETGKQLSQALTQVQEQNTQLAELNRTRNEFFAIAAHDIKNPLSSILGLAELMRQPDNSTEERLESAEFISVSARRLLGLVSNLLDFDRIESGNLSIDVKSRDVTPLVKESIHSFKQQASLKNIAFQRIYATGPIHAQVDESAFRQIVDNLLSNAVKFTPEGGTIYPHIQKAGEVVRVSIRDEGPGIPQNEIATLFDKFQRASTKTNGGEASSGLGLYIVQKLVKEMNGNVHCESEVGKGTTFTVELPAA